MLDTVRLITDSGLVVLIWMVQLIVYPSFSHYPPEHLYKWHSVYTGRIAAIVIPLMFGQLIATGIQVFLERDFYTISSSVLVAGVWISTFTQFVPLHHKIAERQELKSSINKLVTKNWVRTFLWSLLFLLSFYYRIIA